MKHWLVVRGKIKTTYVGVMVMVCHLALIISLCACTSPTFSSGTFSIKAYTKEPSTKSTQQNNVKEDLENYFSTGEVITPKDVDQVTIVDTINTGRSVYSVAFSPDGRLLATGGRRTVKLWDADTKTALWLKGHNHTVLTLAFSPDGRILASGGREDSTIRLWDTASGETLSTLEVPTNYVNSLVFSPDGSVLAAAGYSIHSSGDRSWSGNDDIVMLWDLESGQLLHRFDQDIWGVRTLAFSPNGRILAAGGEGFVLWDTVSWERLHTLDTHTNSLVFSPDGRMLASGGYHNLILWGSKTGEKLRMLEGYNSSITSLAFSPDGRLLVANGCNGIVFWEVTSGTVIHTFSGYKPDGSTNCYLPKLPVAFSPDGRLLASVSSDLLLRLWGIP